MNNKLVLTTLMSILIVLSVGLLVSAQAPRELQELPGSGWWSGEQIQNVGSVTATVQGVAYAMDSTDEFDLNQSFTVGAGNSFTILPSSFNGANFVGMDGKAGAAVVSADQPLVAVVNVTNREVGNLAGVSGGFAAGTYEGADQSKVASQLNFPSFKKEYNGKDTTHYVQNTGTTATDITAQFIYNGNTETAVFNAVAPNNSIAIVPPSAIPAGTLGSLVVTNSEGNNLAGVATEYETGVSVATSLKASTAYVASDFDDVVYVPAYKKDYFQRTSALLIQSDAAVSGVMTFTCVDVDTNDSDTQCTLGQAYTASYTIGDAGGSQTAFAYDAIVTDLPEGLYGVEITSSGGNVVVSLDETGFSGGSDFSIPSPNRDTTSAGIPASKASAKWSCPSVKEVFANNSSAPVIYSIGESAATVNATYVNADGTFTLENQQAESGPSLVLFDVALNTADWANNNGIATGTNNSVTIQADQPVVVIVNENVHYTVSGFQQDAKQYNCFPIN